MKLSNNVIDDASRSISSDTDASYGLAEGTTPLDGTQGSPASIMVAQGGCTSATPRSDDDPMTAVSSKPVINMDDVQVKMSEKLVDFTGQLGGALHLGV